MVNVISKTNVGGHSQLLMAQLKCQKLRSPYMLTLPHGIALMPELCHFMPKRLAFAMINISKRWPLHCFVVDDAQKVPYPRPHFTNDKNTRTSFEDHAHSHKTRRNTTKPIQERVNDTTYIYRSSSCHSVSVISLRYCLVDSAKRVCPKILRKQ